MFKLFCASICFYCFLENRGELPSFSFWNHRLTVYVFKTESDKILTNFFEILNAGRKSSNAITSKSEEDKRACFALFLAATSSPSDKTFQFHPKLKSSSPRPTVLSGQRYRCCQQTFSGKWDGKNANSNQF